MTLTRILVGNDYDDELRRREMTASLPWWAQRLFWLARDGDVMVLPRPADAEFLHYVTSLTDTAPESLSVVVPPPGEQGPDVLTPDRLTDSRCLAEVSQAVRGRRVTEVVPLWPDASIASVARALGIEDACPGAGFLSQNGGCLSNSKTHFRAVAAGVGCPVPDGGVAIGRRSASALLQRLLPTTGSVVLKRDFHSGGAGNEIVTLDPQLVPIGAEFTTLLDEPIPAAVNRYLDQRWDWLTGDGRDAFVIEVYVPAALPVYAEFVVTDGEPEFAGDGLMMYSPEPDYQVTPATGVGIAQKRRLLDGGRRLCVALRDIGYRGPLSADAVITPSGNVLFTEYNGRVTGSRHLYAGVAERVVGGREAQDRVVVERLWRSTWQVGSFTDALARIDVSGLRYTSDRRTGVILTQGFDAVRKAITYCTVAPSLDEALDLDLRVQALFTPATAAGGARPS